MNKLGPVIDVYFEDIYENIIRLLKDARYSVKICVAWISAPRLEKTVELLLDKNVDVEIIYDDSLSNENLRHYRNANLYPISMDGSAFMHNKFCIIDDEVLITGSFNWTYNASRSFENSIVVRNDYKLIKAYLHEFEDLKSYSKLCRLKRKKRVIHPDGSRCNSLAYNIGIFGYGNDMDGSQEVAIWSICNSHRIAECVGKFVINGNDFEDDIDDDTDPYYFSERERGLSKEDMLAQFKDERKSFLAPRNFFRDFLHDEVHAYGFVRERDQGFKATRASDVEYSLQLMWRHIYWRKIIPKELFEDEGNIDRIIEKHRPGGYFGW